MRKEDFDDWELIEILDKHYARNFKSGDLCYVSYRSRNYMNIVNISSGNLLSILYKDLTEDTRDYQSTGPQKLLIKRYRITMKKNNKLDV